MRWFTKWLNRLVEEVPEEIALCEFDCRKPQCSAEEWERCEYRKMWAVLGESEQQRTA